MSASPHAFLDRANLFHGVFETVIKLFMLNVAFAVVMRTKPQTDNLIDAKQDGYCHGSLEWRLLQRHGPHYVCQVCELAREACQVSLRLFSRRFIEMTHDWADLHICDRVSTDAIT